MEFSPDGVLLATGDRNGGMHVWEAHTGREYLTSKGTVIVSQESPGDWTPIFWQRVPLTGA